MAELTFEQLYADLVNAANNPEIDAPADSFTFKQFMSDCGKSQTWVHNRLTKLVEAGKLERVRIGARFYYRFI